MIPSQSPALKVFTSNIAISAVLFVLALAIRLPNMLYIPAYTDEGQEGLWALDIALGRRPLLSLIEDFTGPFFHHTLAALFRLFGASIEMPRMVSVLFGALAVSAVYWLGCVIWNRRAALIAAGLALTSPTLVVWNSHYAWASAWVPFFTTATLASVYAGVTRGSGRLLVLGALLAALSLQLHPTTMVMLIGLGVWMLSSRSTRAWLKQPALYAACAVFVLGYAPMLLSNARGSPPVFADAQERAYAFGIVGSATEYLLRIGSLLRALVATVAGILRPLTIAQLMVASLTTLATVAGLAFAWRAQRRLLGLLFMTTLVMLPIFVLGFSNRYFIYLVPAGYVAIGIVLSEVLSRLRHGQVAWLDERPRLQLPTFTVACLSVILIVSLPLLTIFQHYQFAWAAGETNENYYQLLRVLHEQHACGPRLTLEQVPVPQKPFDSPNFVMNTVHYLMTMDGCEHVSVPTAPTELFDAKGPMNWIVLSPISPPASRDAQRLTTINVPVFSTVVPISIYRSGDNP